jgi:hypothetical protein
MSFQWLTMRIGEEKDRRAREQQILGVLPGAIEDLGAQLGKCVDAFNAALVEPAGQMERTPEGLAVSSAERRVDVVTDTELPGFHVRREATSFAVQVGVLPNGKLFYFDVAGDQYLTMEDLTRRILDRVLFPKLRE